MQPNVDFNSANGELEQDDSISSSKFKVMTQKEFDIKIRGLNEKLKKAEHNNKFHRQWWEEGKVKIEELEKEINSLYQVIRSAEKRDKDEIRKEFAAELEREKSMKRNFLEWLNEI